MTGGKEDFRMENDYIQNMQRMENECRLYIQKADDEFEKYGKHTKEEGRYLQEAARLQTEMAELSDGELRKYHERRAREIGKRIEAVVQAVSPETYQKMIAERSRREAKNADRRDDRPASNLNRPAPGKGDRAVSEEMIQSWFKESPNHSFDDVSGMHALKEELRGSIADAKLMKIRKALKMSTVHSYFFIGPPGCGKTFIIEAFAHELMGKHFKYISLDGSNILSRYVGDAEKIITRLFEEAEENAPCIVFIDEIDGVCRNRSMPDLPVWASSMTTAFLTSYNRINASDKEIIFIGATNYPNKVDDAMLDRVQLIRVDMPDEDALAAAYERKLAGVVRLEPGFTSQEMAKSSVNYNYRDVDRLVEKVKALILKDILEKCPTEEAAVEALTDGTYQLTRALFKTAQDAYTPTPKDAILREIDEWQARYKKNQEAEG